MIFLWCVWSEILFLKEQSKPHNVFQNYFYVYWIVLVIMKEFGIQILDIDTHWIISPNSGHYWYLGTDDPDLSITVILCFFNSPHLFRCVYINTQCQNFIKYFSKHSLFPQLNFSSRMQRGEKWSKVKLQRKWYHLFPFDIYSAALLQVCSKESREHTFT